MKSKTLIELIKLLESLKGTRNKWKVTADRFDSMGAESFVEREHIKELDIEISQLEKHLIENYDS